MSNPGTITLVPVDPTSIITYPPGTAQSGLSTLTSDFLSSTIIPYPSISTISLSSVSANDATFTPTSASADDQTTTFSTAVETGVLSTDAPHDSGFAHQAGAIVGVILAGSFVLLLIILLIFFACKRHHWNRSYTSSMEDILAVSRNTSWRPPLEENDDYQALHGVSMFPNYPGTPASQEHGEGGDDLINSRDSSILPPRSSHDGYYGSSRPWWFPAQPPSSDQRNNPQQLSPIVDLHVEAIGSRSVSSSVLGGSSSSSNDHIPGETPLPTSIPPIHRPSGRSHYSTLPTPSRDSSLRIQQEQEKHDRFNNRISQAIMARLRASQRPSATTAPVRAYSHCTTIGSEVSRAPSYPIISMSQTQTDVMRSSYTPHNVYCQGVDDPSERLWPSLMLPPTPSPSPSPSPTHTLRMVEGLLDPVTIRPPQASTASFQDGNDYSRRFNGRLVNDHLQSTTTLETVDLGEGRA